MNSYPHLKFELNKDLDIKTGETFLFVQAGGIDFGLGVLENYPDLKPARETDNKIKRHEIVAEFVDDFYNKNVTILEKMKSKMQQLWTPVEEQFFRAVQTIFGQYAWPNGQYIAYPSMFNCNPRFLDTKTFQCYYGKIEEGRSNSTVAHEMLHFIWFDYLEKEALAFMNQYSEDKIWLLSEAFNQMVQALPSFELFQARHGYPEAESMVNSLRAQLSENFTIEQFFEVASTLKEMEEETPSIV